MKIYLLIKSLERFLLSTKVMKANICDALKTTRFKINIYIQNKTATKHTAKKLMKSETSFLKLDSFAYV